MAEVLAVTGPIYLLILLGWGTTRLGWFERAEMRVFGRFVIQLALPALLFNALAQRSAGEVLNPVFVAAYLGGSLAVMLAGMLWMRRAGRRSRSASAIAGMGMACPNSGFIGFPLVAQLFGMQTAGVGLALAMVVENFLLLPLALAVAESDGARGQRWQAALAQSLRGVLRNPMIHGIALGFAFSLLGWQLPAPVSRAVDLLAMACAGLSLFVIGGSLAGIRPHGMVRDVLAITVGKLLLHPLAVAGMLLLLPDMPRELELTVVVMAAVPMLGVYPILAQKHGHDAMAAAAQLVATVVSFVTLTALLVVLRA